jgi:hypothetical protein
MFKEITYREALEIMDIKSDYGKKNVVLNFLRGYNTAVHRANRHYTYEVNKTCGYCGAINYYTNRECIKCNCKF